MYIIGPTKTSEKKRVLTVLGHIGTFKQGIRRKVVCVCPSDINEYERFTELNGIALFNHNSPNITCGNRNYTFNIKVHPNPTHSLVMN